MPEKITEADALRRFPELHDLLAIREAGWTFRTAFYEDGELSCVIGSLSRQQYTDAIFIFDRTNVSAARVLDDSYGGGCVWSK